MELNKRIETFAKLGEILRDTGRCIKNNYNGELLAIVEQSHFKNGWFTPDNVRRSISSIAGTLTMENLYKWMSVYPIVETTRVKNIGVIMAGNIPLVGFHDFLSVLITGNRIMAKRSSKDADLITAIAKILGTIESSFSDYIEFVDGKLAGFDAIIATGSDNSSRYFEYYFSKYDNIIRKNRNSIAILDGSEDKNELKSLGEDIFSYFGLGCRSISKIYIPKGYDIMVAVNEWDDYSEIINHSKYANNYDYNKAIYLVNKEEFIDTGFMLIKKEKAISSPVSVLYFEEYDSTDSLNNVILSNQDRLQSVTGHGHLPFGKAQNPDLWDYADGVDTIDFILKINLPNV
ncbi:MAG: acyl-CoA reductase [Bacteroidales bacterium]|jgi:hypothetical protein